MGEKPRGNSHEKPGEFIIYNQNKHTSPPANGNPVASRKDDIVNKLLEKERDPSQSARKVFLDGSGNKNKFMTPKVSKTQLGRTHETPNDPQREENKIVVDLKKSNSKSSQASGRRTPLAEKQYIKTTVSSKNKEFFNVNVASPQVRGVSPSHTNQTSRRTPYSADPTISSPKYEVPMADPQDTIKNKNREILNEINDLDFEIQK